MKTMIRAGLLCGLMLLAPAMPAAGQMAAAPQQCASVTPPPAELAGWTTRSAITASADAAGLASAALVLGKGADVALRPDADVRYAAAPGKKTDTKGSSGLLAVEIKEAGIYRVALGAGAWIDVIRDGKVLTSIRHGHGPECSGIRKIVDFELTPGIYVVQIAGSPVAELPVLVAPAA